MKLPLPHIRLVLCEGAHDLWTIKRALEVHLGYTTVKAKLDELLHPLAPFVRSRVKSHYLKVRADSAGGTEKPNFSLVMKKPDHGFFLAFFTASGGLNNDDCREWLNEARAVFRPRRFGASPGKVERAAGWSLAIVVDADSDPVAAATSAAEWYGVDSLEGGGYLNTEHGLVGLWIWPDGVGENTGTLEDILEAVDGGPTDELGANIRRFLDENAPSGCKYIKHGEAVVVRARQTKARLGVRAQWDHPGASWASWLRKPGLDDSFVGSVAALHGISSWLDRGSSSSDTEATSRAYRPA